jgi:hypothetical protein
MANPKSEPWFTDPWEDPEEAENDARYIEVTGEYDRLSRDDFARGRLLRQIRDEKLYGRWGSFEACVWRRLKVTKERAYQLISAADNFDLLEEHGCQLPINERQCRPLRLLRDKDDLKLLAWSRACAQKDGGSPDGNDVWREVRRLLPTPDQESDSAYRAYRQRLESAISEYRKAHAMLEEGEMDGFMAADDKKSQRQKKRLLAMLEKFTATLEEDALALQGMEVESNQSELVSQIFDSKYSRRDHSLLPCSSPITRFTDVLATHLGSAA